MGGMTVVSISAEIHGYKLLFSCKKMELQDASELGSPSEL